LGNVRVRVFALPDLILSRSDSDSGIGHAVTTTDAQIKAARTEVTANVDPNGIEDRSSARPSTRES
jgi:hypothetical protein